MEDIKLTPQKSDEMKCTYSAVVSKDGKPMISILFERGKDSAEGVIPSCDIVKSNGFSGEEIEALEEYMKANKSDFIEKAKKITNIKYMMR